MWTFLKNFKQKQEKITKVGSAILLELHQHLITGDFTHGQMAVAHGEEHFVCDRFLQGELASDKFPWITSKRTKVLPMTVPEVSFMDYLETTKEAQPITTSEMYHVLFM